MSSVNFSLYGIELLSDDSLFYNPPAHHNCNEKYSLATNEFEKTNDTHNFLFNWLLE